jgi:Arc/MetJ-type ribon-helix-helix transcriptional regulator
MSTLSVPMPPDLLKALENLINRGMASSKADAVRKAVEKYIEQMAVEEILQASREPSLEGDLDELLKKI